MKRIPAFKQGIVLLAMAGLLASCVQQIQTTGNYQHVQVGWFYKIRSKIFPPRKVTPHALVPLWMGTVSLVDMDKGFVLIDSNALYAAIPGKELRCLSKERGTEERETAKLRISVEKNPPFFIADIVSGTPHVGDRVYIPDHP